MIAANWAEELPGRSVDEILDKLLAAYHGKKFARAYLLFEGKFDEIDPDEFVQGGRGTAGVRPRDFANSHAWRESHDFTAAAVYLNGFALERRDFQRWCEDNGETAPKFWKVAETAKAPAPEARSPEDVDPYRTGLPSRPSIRHLITQEFARRVKDGEWHRDLSDEADALIEWAKKTHSSAPTPAIGTIKNHIRKAHLAAVSQRPE